MRIFIFAGALLSLWSCASTPKQSVDEGSDPRKLEVFLRHDEVSSVEISPDGSTLAVLSNATGETRIAFLRSADLQVVGGFQLTGSDIFRRVEWANNTRIVAELANTDGPLSIPKSTGEILAVNADGTNQQLIFSFRNTERQTGTSIKKRERAFAWGTIVDTLPNDENEILVMSQDWGAGNEIGAVEVQRVHVVTGLRRRVAGGPGAAFQYFTDEKHEVRVALTRTRDSMIEGHWLDDQRAWQRLDKLGSFSIHATPVGFSSAKRTIYAIDEDEEGPALFAFSLDDGSRRVVVREKGIEPSNIWFDAQTGAPVAVEFEPDFPKWKIVDSKHSIATILRAAFQYADGRQVRIVSLTPDQQQAVVFIYSDREPGAYALVRAAGPTIKPLFARRPDTQGASKVPVTVQASDGMEIRGYLTSPKNPPATPPPLIVLPHGGPHGIRDHWYYDPEVQLFASSGYAVLQVNFRGSGGYGHQYETAGYRKWGDRVQDDIIEATRWAIAQKHADPARICTFGGSFGAYSAVQSSIRAPELFKCAVGYAGVYDLSLFFEEGDVYLTERGRAYLEKAVGSDSAQLAAASPAKNADKIPVPVLLIHGEKDRRAPISHAESLCEAMRDANKTCQEHYVSDEYHGFFDLGNRVEAYTLALDFIEKQLGGIGRAVE